MAFPRGYPQWLSLAATHNGFPSRVPPMAFPRGYSQWLSLAGTQNGRRLRVLTMAVLHRNYEV